MSLGLLTNVASIYAQNNLNQTQQSLQNTLTQLSSGSRINSGADDAAGLAVADGLHANESALEQSTRNASDGIGLLQTADGALSQVTNLLNRAVTLATESANGTLNSNQVSAANQEFQNILSEIGNIGSTTNYNGNSVFTANAKSVFVSDGTSSGSNNFSETIGTLSASGVGIAAPQAAATLSISPTTPNVATSGTSSPTFSAPTTPGASTASSSTLAAVASTDTLSGSLSITYAGGSAVNVTLPAGSTLANTVTSINSALTSAGISGLSAAQGTGANANKIILTGSNGASNTLSITQSITDSNAATGTAASSTISLNNATDTFGGNLSISYAGGAATNLTVTSGSTIAQLAAQINAAGISGVTATAGTGINANKLTISGTAGAGNTLSFTGSALTDTNLATSTNGAGVNFGASSNVSQLNATTASAVLTGVTSAIADVAYQRGLIGAQINQLTAASNVASSESVNLTSAESNIRSTNYGQAASDLAKYQVLSQTGISAVAQANSVQQEVLKLLQG